MDSTGPSANAKPYPERDFLGFPDTPNLRIEGPAFSCRIFTTLGGEAGLDKHNRLGAGNIKAFAATHILAHKHIVDSHHIVTRLLETRPILLTCAPRNLTLLRALEPANLIVGPLTTMGATKGRSLDFLYLVEEITFVHLFLFLVRQTTESLWLTVLCAVSL